MSDTQFKRSFPRRCWNILQRVLVIAAVAFTIGWVLNQISSSLERSPQPAGFGRGVVQGALMPMAMPNLLVGKDVVIYAARNTGLSYKLGYTAGVNGCGLLFFGVFFWRLRRLKKWASGKPQAPA